MLWFCLLYTSFDFIVIDCPPVDAVADAIPVSCVTDGTIYIVSAKETNTVSYTHLDVYKRQFLGGAFVPQSMISESILTISRFIPTYWYVKANDTLANLNNFDGQEIHDILSYMGIEVLFLIACSMIALLIMRNRKTQEAFISVGDQA